MEIIEHDGLDNSFQFWKSLNQYINGTERINWTSLPTCRALHIFPGHQLQTMNQVGHGCNPLQLFVCANNRSEIKPMVAPSTLHSLERHFQLPGGLSFLFLSPSESTYLKLPGSIPWESCLIKSRSHFVFQAHFW